MQVVACIFQKLDKDNKLINNGEKPYFYLDQIMLNIGDYGLVHNGSDFAVVKVYGTFTTDVEKAITRVTKPIISRVLVSQDLMSEASRRLKEFHERTENHRIQSNINDIVGYDKPTFPALGEPKPATAPVATFSSDIDDEIPF